MAVPFPGGARVHPAGVAGWGGDITGVEIRRFGRGAEALVGAGAGRTGGLAPPAHRLGSGRDASSDFGLRGLFAGLVLGFLPVKQGFLVLGGFLSLGSSGSLFLVMTVEGPD